MQFLLQLAMQFYTLERCKIGKYKFASKFADILLNVPNIGHKFTSLKSRIVLQVARKIAPCDSAFTLDVIYYS